MHTILTVLNHIIRAWGLFIPSLISCRLVLVLILFVSLIHRRSWGSLRFRGNLLYARYIVFRPLASAYRGIPTLTVSSEDSPSLYSYGTRQCPIHILARACIACTCKPHVDVLVSITEAAPNVLFCTYFPLIHPSRPLTPLTTVYQAG